MHSSPERSAVPTKPNPTPPADREWLTLAETHRVFGLHPVTVRRMAEDNELPADTWTRIGARGIYRINRRLLDAHLRSTRHVGTDTAA